MILKQIVKCVRLTLIWLVLPQMQLLLSGKTLGGIGGEVDGARVVGGEGVGMCLGSDGGRLRLLINRGRVGHEDGRVKLRRLLQETKMSPLRPEKQRKNDKNLLFSMWG